PHVLDEVGYCLSGLFNVRTSHPYTPVKGLYLRFERVPVTEVYASLYAALRSPADLSFCCGSLGGNSGLLYGLHYTLCLLECLLYILVIGYADSTRQFSRSLYCTIYNRHCCVFGYVFDKPCELFGVLLVSYPQVLLGLPILTYSFSS